MVVLVSTPASRGRRPVDPQLTSKHTAPSAATTFRCTFNPRGPRSASRSRARTPRMAASATSPSRSSLWASTAKGPQVSATMAWVSRMDRTWQPSGPAEKERVLLPATQGGAVHSSCGMGNSAAKSVRLPLGAGSSVPWHPASPNRATAVTFHSSRVTSLAMVKMCPGQVSRASQAMVRGSSETRPGSHTHWGPNTRPLAVRTGSAAWHVAPSAHSTPSHTSRAREK
mmetsp:Transcript_23841/g.54223  ORF Transcript_23841/g.54223 Transcript_23841/m.54223 type:complete len:227 (-) Transcript_23841:1731-2411(-)